MATKSSIHIKPCNIASSEAHNRRTAEYMRNIGESRIYVVPELSIDNEQFANRISKTQTFTDLHNYLTSSVIFYILPIQNKWLKCKK